MYKNYLHVYCVLSLFLAACSSPEQELTFSPPQFQDTIHLTGRVVNDSFMMGTGYDIHLLC